jgi:hypothetical protein
MKGTLRGDPLLGNLKDEVFERCKMPLRAGFSLCRCPVGEPGGGSFAGTFERQEKYIWVPFLDLEAIKI